VVLADMVSRSSEMIDTASIPQSAIGLRLARIDRKQTLILCEPMRFENRDAVETVLRRAAVAGLVDMEGAIDRHFVDVLDEGGDIVETIALGRRAYSALKNRWMRCRVERTIERGWPRAERVL